MSNEYDDDTVVVSNPKEQDADIKPPSMWAVVFINDDYTSMDFVIHVLQRYFGHGQEKAITLMLDVHQNGEAVAGTYSLDIAETKRLIVIEEARANGFPLMLHIREVE